MRTLNPPILLAALPPVIASFAVLAIADVSKGVWFIHLLAIALSYLLALTGNRLLHAARSRQIAFSIIFLTLLGIAAPLLSDSSGPDRWVSLGPLNLYMAPLLLPSFLAACSVYARKDDSHEIFVIVAVLSVTLLLAIQPDASQALALSLGSAVAFLKYKSNTLRSGVTIALATLVTAWSFTRPDPLQPVPYVEEVFRLTFGYSLFVGIIVIACAISLVATLWVYSFKGATWLSAVATYYAALFACSIAGITPAPLIGYGSGPILGFGLMTAIMHALASELFPNYGIKGTSE